MKLFILGACITVCMWLLVNLSMIGSIYLLSWRNDKNSKGE